MSRAAAVSSWRDRSAPDELVHRRAASATAASSETIGRHRTSLSRQRPPLPRRDAHHRRSLGSGAERCAVHAPRARDRTRPARGDPCGGLDPSAARDGDGRLLAAAVPVHLAFSLGWAVVLERAASAAPRAVRSRASRSPRSRWVSAGAGFPGSAPCRSRHRSRTTSPTARSWAHCSPAAEPAAPVEISGAAGNREATRKGVKHGRSV